ncbi:hypothetical protein VTH06DRAFT_7429 [Thermothelomyces fergusii]
MPTITSTTIAASASRTILRCSSSDVRKISGKQHPELSEAARSEIPQLKRPGLVTPNAPGTRQALAAANPKRQLSNSFKATLRKISKLNQAMDGRTGQEESSLPQPIVSSQTPGKPYQSAATVAAQPVLTSASAHAHDITYSKSFDHAAHQPMEGTNANARMSWGRRAAAVAVDFGRWRSNKTHRVISPSGSWLASPFPKQAPTTFINRTRECGRAETSGRVPDPSRDGDGRS